MKKYYSCNCGSEIVEIQRFDPTKESPDTSIFDQEIFFAIFEYGTRKISLWTRLCWCWKTLFQHKYHGDQIILDIKDAYQMGKDLIKMASADSKGELICPACGETTYVYLQKSVFCLACESEFNTGDMIKKEVK